MQNRKVSLRFFVLSSMMKGKGERKMKKLVLALLCALALCVGALAAEGDVVVSLRLGEEMMQVNGVSGEIDPGRGTKPLIVSERTLVPIRAVIEAFGGTVGWDGATQSAVLQLGGDTVRLVLGSTTAYFNDEVRTLDVAPVAINERTMLPIRFVAESFGLGVAWDGATGTVSVLRQEFAEDEYDALMSVVPEYSDKAWVIVNGNEPLFASYELVPGSFEYYGALDDMGRCGVCFASVGTDLMPTEDRGSIGAVKPTGWVNGKYEHVDGSYLYNRCHLIGFQLTGENANEKNLITGTRYLNIDGMLPFENAVADFVKETGMRVLYRVTPVFTENNLLADGVLMEAQSVEDGGEGLSFCVYCYNVQPYVDIDYATGANALAGNVIPSVEQGIYRTPSGKKYHFDPECGGKYSYETTIEEVRKAGLEPCARCAA